MTASDAQAMSMRDLLAMAAPEEREAFEGMWLGYTETFGAPDLREAIAATYTCQSATDILFFAGQQVCRLILTAWSPQSAPIPNW